MKQENLFEILRQWRNSQAIQEGKQPFMVFNNATLKITAEIQPNSIKQLHDIKGWGPAKIQKYGPLILDLIHNPDIQDKEPIIQDNTLSVSQCIGLLNRHLKDLTILKVQGEFNDISKRERYAFFNIKDKTGEYTMPCFIGWQKFEAMQHLLEEGLEVIIHAEPSIYKNGRLSLEIKRIEPVGKGALKKALELLKKQLKKLGYFSTERKQEIVNDINNIALITSKNGAAIKDFKKNLAPFGLKISFYHVYVEGDSAVDSIFNTIQKINRDEPKLNLIVLIRGGGGLENLKAFNDKQIADAIINSRIPILTGIGHEPDISIADLCADHYVSTPTAAALYINEKKESLQKQFDLLNNELTSSIQRFLNEYKYKIELLQQKMTTGFAITLTNKKANLKNLTESLSSKVTQFFIQIKDIQYSLLQNINKYKNFIKEKLYNLDTITIESITTLKMKSTMLKNKILIAEQNIKNLNPENILKKGYSIVSCNNKIVKDIKILKKGKDISIKFYKGKAEAKIINIKK